MDRVFNFFIEKWRLAISIIVFGIVVGAVGIISMNKQTFPSVNTGNVVVTTIYPGSSAKEVKDEVSQVIEDQLKSVTGLKDVTSISQNGLSRIVIRVDIDRYDYKEVFDDIQKAVNKAGPLPDTIVGRPLAKEIKSDEVPVMNIKISSQKSGRELDALAKKLKDELELLNDVARIDLQGYSSREFQILIDPVKIERFQISVAEIARAVQNSVQDVPAGNITQDSKTRLVRVTGKSTSIEKLKQTVVRANFNGNVVRLSDISEIKDLPRDKDVLVTVDRENAIRATVVKKSEADTIHTTDAVKKSLEKFTAKIDKKFNIEVYDDESDRVKAKLGIALDNAAIGFILVSFFLLIFFPNLAGVFTALSLPIVVMFTMGIIPAFGADFNNITLLAIIISLGLLVDNAIVIGENYIRLRNTGLSPIDAAKAGVSQFWLPITATALTTIAAFVPMLVTKGVMGDFLKYIPIVVSIALFLSLVESFILLPARLRFSVRKTTKASQDTQSDDQDHVDRGWFGKVQMLFEKFLLISIRFRYLTTTVIFCVMISAIYVQVKFNYFDVFPKEDVEVYFARFETEPGTAMESTMALGKELEEAVVLKLEEKFGDNTVEHSVVTIGNTQESNFDVYANYGDHTGSLRIMLPTELAPQITVNEFLETIRSIRPEGITDLSWLALANGPPVGKALEITLISNDRSALEGATDFFKQELAKYEGVFDINDSDPDPVEEVNFIVDQQKIAGVGLSLTDLGYALRSSLEGTVVSDVNVDGENVQIRLRFEETSRNDPENLLKVRIPNPAGYLVPISKVAEIKDGLNIPKVTRYQYQDSITVSAEVDNVKMNSVKLNEHAETIKQNVLKRFPEVGFVTLGQAESTAESVGSLMTALGYSALAIFLILVFIFDSFIKPLIVLLSIPLSLVGVFYAFALHGRPLSFFALVGIVGLAGVVINSSIILISFVDDLRKEGKLSGVELLARATSARLRPVMVTTLTTVGGLLPTAYGLGGHDATLKPLTLAMGWGLISGTILVLVALPTFLAILEDFKNIFSRKQKG